MCTKAVCVMEISVFWDMTPSNRAQIYDRFRGTCRLCLQCINVFFVEFIPFLYIVCRSDIRVTCFDRIDHPQTLTCVILKTQNKVHIYIHTGCHRRNGPNFGRVFLMLNYTDITQNTYVQS